MSAVRVRVYVDQFEDIQVEVDGRKILQGPTVQAWVDNVDIEAFVRRVVVALVEAIPVENTEVTT